MTTMMMKRTNNRITLGWHNFHGDKPPNVNEPVSANNSDTELLHLSAHALRLFSLEFFFAGSDMQPRVFAMPYAASIDFIKT